MKTGRNDPCPCGSGKKFKYCCLEKQSFAQAIADEIAETAREQPFSTLEDLNAFAQQQMEQRNHTALDEFCGLNPEQMSHLLHFPFESPQTVRFNADVASTRDSEIMQLFIPLVEAIGEDGLKTTAKGNLPLKFCKEMRERMKQANSDKNWRNIDLHIGGISSETDMGTLHCTRLVAQLSGLIRKYRGKFVLTKKCKKMLDLEDYGNLYFELFKAFTIEFNWAYRDGYPEAVIIQHSFVYTLFLLAKFGDKERPQQFYEDKFLDAFPMALGMFPETSYGSADEVASNCYFLRAMDRFAVFFGLAEFNLKSRKKYREKYLVSKSALLDVFVSFK